MTDSTVTRRRVIAMGSVGAIGAAGLAACSSDSGGSATDSTGGSEGSATGSATGQAPSGLKLAKLTDVPVGTAIVLDASGQKILLAQPKEGQAVAYSAICTHQGCTVAGGAQAKCPCHGSMFDIATGKPTNGPATKALPAVAVSVNENGEVVLGD
jgi:cytochrome b6-f complex iron-sulfur subunit